MRLAPEQRLKLKAVFKQANKQRENEAMPPLMNYLRGLMPDQSELDLMEKALKVLTPEQRKKFDKMKGKPIEHLPPPGFGSPTGAANAPSGHWWTAGALKGNRAMLIVAVGQQA
jgi:hypothetical protein